MSAPTCGPPSGADKHPYVPIENACEATTTDSHPPTQLSGSSTRMKADLPAVGCRLDEIVAAELRDRYVSIFGSSNEAELAYIEMAMAVPQLEKRCRLLELSPRVRPQQPLFLVAGSTACEPLTWHNGCEWGLGAGRWGGG